MSCSEKKKSHMTHCIFGATEIYTGTDLVKARHRRRARRFEGEKKEEVGEEEGKEKEKKRSREKK